uniref:Uncharacterized protein n=1 Tax=Arundo donax TaxID=35708 RepID=A0A0A8YCU3_ARUDO
MTGFWVRGVLCCWGFLVFVLPLLGYRVSWQA